MQVYILRERDNLHIAGIYDKEKLDLFFEDRGGIYRFSVQAKEWAEEKLTDSVPDATVGCTAHFNIETGEMTEYVEHGHQRDEILNPFYGKAWMEEYSPGPTMVFCHRITDFALANLFFKKKLQQLKLLGIECQSVYDLTTLEGTVWNSAFYGALNARYLKGLQIPCVNQKFAGLRKWGL